MLNKNSLCLDLDLTSEGSLYVFVTVQSLLKCPKSETLLEPTLRPEE